MISNFFKSLKKLAWKVLLLWYRPIINCTYFHRTTLMREKTMLKSDRKLVAIFVAGSLLLPLTVHAAVISHQTTTQNISSLALLGLGILSFALGRHLKHQ